MSSVIQHRTCLYSTPGIAPQLAAGKPASEREEHSCIGSSPLPSNAVSIHKQYWDRAIIIIIILLHKKQPTGVSEWTEKLGQLE